MSRLLTNEDARWIAEHFADGTITEDDDGPTDVMTSIGYVAVWSDGQIDAFGVMIASVDPDGCRSGVCPVCHYTAADCDPDGPCASPAAFHGNRILR